MCWNVATRTILSALILLSGPALAADLDPRTSDEKTIARQDAQRHAGLRVGAWDTETTGRGGNESETPSFEGYFERELDVRLAIESTAGFWRHSREQSTTDITGTSSEEVENTVLPIFTHLKFYPVKREQRLSPYVSAGIGLALGMSERDVAGSAFLTGEDSSVMATGYGYKFGAGMDWRLSPAFGISLTARQQWVRFDTALDGQRTWDGMLVEAGLTYRFQKN